MTEFNKSKYDIEYIKEHYSRFLVDLPKDEKEELDNLLKEESMSKSQFLKDAIERYKKSTNPIICILFEDYIVFYKYDEETNIKYYTEAFKIKEDENGEFISLSILDVLDTILNTNKHNITFHNHRTEKWDRH